MTESNVIEVSRQYPTKDATARTAPVSDTRALNRFLAEEFPQFPARVQSVNDDGVVLRLEVGEEHLRPGGTVSGPTIMTLADGAIYMAILARVGLVALAVTTSLNFNFLRRPAANCPLVAHCKLLKLGKVLAVAEVTICSEGSEAPVAHAVGTYSIPPGQAR